jgi:glycosyltransferase involved in cell wall biosynthesis
MRIAVAQLGARRHYAVPRILAEAGLLERLFTDSYAGNKPWLAAGLRALPRRWRPDAVERWLGRDGVGVPPERVTSFETLGLGYAGRLRRMRARTATEQLFADTNYRFNRRILAHGLGPADVVWGFNGAALELFRAARAEGRRCILDQTMAPHRHCRRLLARERRRWPGWDPAPVEPEDDTPLDGRETAEWALADLIVAGSAFVVDGIAAEGGPAGKCRVVPYGTDLRRFSPPAARPAHDGPLRLLFVGEVGLRKGVPYLLEAARRLGPGRVEARFVGRVVLDPARLAAYADVAEFRGPVPRPLMPEVYRWADLLVLPSVCEGSAAVLYEALAAGVPVLCTRSAGPPPVPGLQVVDEPRAIVDLARELRRSADPAAVRRLVALDAYADRLLAAIRTAPA